jgi:hypothetical protein
MYFVRSHMRQKLNDANQWNNILQTKISLCTDTMVTTIKAKKLILISFVLYMCRYCNILPRSFHPPPHAFNILPGPFHPPPMPSVSIFIWRGYQNDWCGHKLRPNHAHPLYLALPGENPVLYMYIIVGARKYSHSVMILAFCVYRVRVPLRVYSVTWTHEAGLCWI